MAQHGNHSSKFVSMMKPILIAIIDRYASQEALSGAVARDTDLGALLREHWDDVMPNYAMVRFMLRRVAPENIAKVNKYLVMAWLESERPTVAMMIDGMPGAFDWLGRSVDRIMCALPLSREQLGNQHTEH